MAAAGWATLSSLVALKDDADLDLAGLKRLLKRVQDTIHQQPDDVRLAMNGFLIAVGTYVQSLTELGRAGRGQGRPGFGQHGRDGLQGARRGGAHSEGPRQGRDRQETQDREMLNSPVRLTGSPRALQLGLWLAKIAITSPLLAVTRSRPAATG